MAVKQLPIQRIDRADVEAIIQAIIKDGCCIIKDFTDAATIKQVNEEVQPYLDADKPWKVGGQTLSDPCTSNNIRVTSFHLKHAAVRTSQAVAKLPGKTGWSIRSFVLYTSEAICSIAMTFDIGPGAKAQRLHRDDKNFHVDHEDQSTTGYRVGSDVMMAFMVPGVKTTVENGATIAIPGSHLWGSDRAPKLDEAVAAELDVTDCWVMLGGLYHAGGANVTQNERRVVHGMFFTRGFHRQEENIYLANTAEEVLSWSPEAQKVMGYEVSSPNIGFVGFQTPLQYLRGEGVGDAFGDFDPSQEQPN